MDQDGDADPDYVPSLASDLSDAEIEDSPLNEGEHTNPIGIAKSRVKAAGQNKSSDIEIMDQDGDADPDYVPILASDVSDAEIEDFHLNKGEQTNPKGTEKSRVKAAGRNKSSAYISATKNDGKKRVWDRRNACYYCNTLVSNIARHLRRQHGDETEVKKALSFHKGSKQRFHLLQKIRHLGNFYNNAKVLMTKQGEFIVAKRPPKDTQVAIEEYAPCIYCKGYFISVEIYRHYKDCKFKTDSNNDIDEFECVAVNGGGLRASRILKDIVTDSGNMKNIKAELFGNMKLDDVGIVCKGDQILSTLGTNLMASKGSSHSTYIRAKMREMGRLLLTVRKQSEKYANFSMQEILKPDMFDAVIEGIQTSCRFSCESKGASPKFEIPSLALKMGHSLKKCAYIKQGLCIRNKDACGEKEVDSFLKLLNMEFTTKVSTIALNTLSKKQQQKPQMLPLTSDIVKFQSFIKEKVNSSIQDLMNDDHDESYATRFHTLVKSTLSRIISFNKRRSGEVGRMFLTDYTERQGRGNVGSEDALKMLTSAEQKLSGRLDLMTINGKRGRRVPVILTSEMCSALEKISDKDNRNRAGISPENPFICPLSRGSLNNVRGYDALAECVKEANLTQPDWFKSTNLRKYVATVSQVLNMDNNEMDWLAGHLGHDIRVHRQFYRLRDEQVELAKVSKLLYAVDNGKAHLYAGKKLEEIQIDGLEDVQEDEEDDDGEPDDAAVHDLLMDYDQDNSGESPVGMVADGMKAVPRTGRTGEFPVGMVADGMKAVPRTGRTGESPMGMMADGIKAAPRTGKKSCKHTAWSREEMDIIFANFHDAIKKNSVKGIGKRECENAILKSKGVLSKRTWAQVKSCVKIQ